MGWGTGEKSCEAAAGGAWGRGAGGEPTEHTATEAIVRTLVFILNETRSHWKVLNKEGT